MAVAARSGGEQPDDEAGAPQCDRPLPDGVVRLVHPDLPSRSLLTTTSPTMSAPLARTDAASSLAATFEK